jgi:hypothetical protein
LLCGANAFFPVQKYIGQRFCFHIATNTSDESLRAARFWEDFAHDPDLVRTYFVLSDAADLLREAVLCYDAKAYMATCMCVRASMEATLHAARRTRNLNAPQLHGPKSADVSLSNTQWQWLIRWATRNGLVDRDLKGRVNRARSLGNLGAHLAQRKARAYREQRKVIRRHPTFQMWSIKLWPAKGDAANSLHTCRDLLLRIATQRWPE